MLGLIVAAAGCSSVATNASGGTGTQASCGAMRTAANVPVVIRVARGHVACPTALKVEKDYATMIARGEVRGNGGGAPIRVDGWTCQGYTTPEVLRTGNASHCQSGSSEILAALDMTATSAPSATATASPAATPSAATPSAATPSATTSSATASAG